MQFSIGISIVALAFTACFHQKAKTAPDAAQPIPSAHTVPACGDTIYVPVNDSFSLQLRIPVATGYRWLYSDSLPALQLLVPNPPSTESDNPAQDGGFGRQTFRFRALQTGDYTIHFKYLRAFGKQVAADSCSFLVRVK